MHKTTVRNGIRSFVSFGRGIHWNDTYQVIINEYQPEIIQTIYKL